MLRVAARNDGRDRERRQRMPGWKAAASADQTDLVLKPRVPVVSVKGKIPWTDPSIGGMHDEGQNLRVSDSFRGKQCCFLCIGILANHACDIKTNRCDHRADRAYICVDYRVEPMKGSCTPEIRSRVGIGGNQPYRERGDAQCRRPVVPLADPERKGPNMFLILGDIRNKLLPSGRPHPELRTGFLGNALIDGTLAGRGTLAGGIRRGLRAKALRKTQGEENETNALSRDLRASYH